MTTYYKLTEQAKRLIKGGNPSVASNVKDEEIREYIGQAINDALRTEYFSTVLPTGETIPAGYMLANYEGLPIEKFGKASRVKLPAAPIALPRDMGLFHVGPEDDPDCFYIPVLPGQGRFFKSQSLINQLYNATYERVHQYIVFDRDLSGKDRKVNVQMVVLDMSAYTEYDILPIPASMEKTIIDIAVARFAGEPRPDKVIDSTAEVTKIQQPQNAR